MNLIRPMLRVPLLFLAVLEAFAFLMAPSIGQWLLRGAWPAGLAPAALLYASILSLSLLSLGLYSRRQRARLSGVLLRAVAGVLAGSAVAGLFAFLLPWLSIERGEFLLAAMVSVILVSATRIGFDRIVDDELFKRRVLILGAGRRATSVLKLRRRSDQRGFVVHGYVASPGEPVAVPADRLMEPGEHLLAYCRANEIDEIVVALDDRRRNFPVHTLIEARLGGIDIIELVDFLERETGKVRLDVLNPSWIIFADGFRRTAWRQISGRIFDVSVSLLLLALVWPVMLLAMLAIKLEEGPAAPVLYRQVRVGLEGRRFNVLKFRSMRVDAERGRAQWAAKADPRVTKVGGFMRKSRVDELPQLVNVLVGDMSFVGPRPERPEFVEGLEQRIPYYRERHAVKPGITGWAQLCYPYGSSEEDAAEKLQFDLYYVKNHTLLFDLVIMLQTAEVVLWGKGR